MTENGKHRIERIKMKILAFYSFMCYNEMKRNLCNTALNERKSAMTAVKEKAYAKINLYIDVDSLRQDGFHDIVTVMHSVSLSDEITVSLLSRGARRVTLILDGNKRLPTDAKNLCVVAANAFLERASIDADILIRLNKRIPISAGLAGGSSDAAAVLRALNKLFKRRLTDKVLLDLALSVGSDVPYCLIGGTALCKGRGERIERLNSALSLHTVVAVAKEHVSTPQAYKLLDERYSSFDGSIAHSEPELLNGVCEGAKSGVLALPRLYNIFESVILPSCPGAMMIRSRMTELGASFSLMSGSGPSVFGIFPTEESARAAETVLREEGITAFYAHSV